VLNHRVITFALLFISFNFLTTPAIAATGTVISTLDAAGYTYVEADIGTEKIWLAGPKTTLAKGSSITLNTSKPMHNFHSKTLNRDFPLVYFVDGFSAASASATSTALASDSPHNAEQNRSPETITLSQPVERAKDGLTIAEIIAGKKDLSGKTVKVRGQITKFTANVMGKNWIHIIDGSTDKDLTVVTKDNAEIGQIAVIEGNIVLDKDFGYGYFYELLVDNASVSVE